MTDEELNRPQPQQITTTNPDPSVATTTNLLREITGSRELAQVLVNFTREIVERQMRGDREFLNVRIDHLESQVNKHPSDVASSIGYLAVNVDEKLKVFEREFANIQIQFTERDTRLETGRVDSNKAIDAAFASADKAINKTEQGFKDQITEQGRRIDTVSRSGDEKINDVKEMINDQKDRITALEGRTQGITMQKTETFGQVQQHTAGGTLITAIVFGVLGSMLGLGGFIIAMIRHL